MCREYYSNAISWQKQYLPYTEEAKKEANDILKFINVMNQGSLDKLMLDHNKKGRQPLEGDFLFAPPLVGNGEHLLPPDKFESPRHCYMGGKYGLVIGFREKNNQLPVWLSLTSFFYYSRGRADLLQPQSYISIVQLQGCTNQGDLPARREFVKNVFHHHNWAVPVSAVIKLAQYLHTPEVAIEPVDHKEFERLGSMSYELAKERYDGTAMRCGFTQQGLKDSFVLNLDYQETNLVELQMAS